VGIWSIPKFHTFFLSPPVALLPEKDPHSSHTQSTEGWVSLRINLEILRRGKSLAVPRMKLLFFSHIDHGHYYTDTAL
jgi:hypothetical protein